MSVILGLNYKKDYLMTYLNTTEYLPYQMNKSRYIQRYPNTKPARNISLEKSFIPEKLDLEELHELSDNCQNRSSYSDVYRLMIHAPAPYQLQDFNRVYNDTSYRQEITNRELSRISAGQMIQHGHRKIMLKDIEVSHQPKKLSLILASVAGTIIVSCSGLMVNRYIAGVLDQYIMMIIFLLMITLLVIAVPRTVEIVKEQVLKENRIIDTLQDIDNVRRKYMTLVNMVNNDPHSHAKNAFYDAYFDTLHYIEETLKLYGYVIQKLSRGIFPEGSWSDHIIKKMDEDIHAITDDYMLSYRSEIEEQSSIMPESEYTDNDFPFLTVDIVDKMWDEIIRDYMEVETSPETILEAPAILDVTVPETSKFHDDLQCARAEMDQWNVMPLDDKKNHLQDAYRKVSEVRESWDAAIDNAYKIGLGRLSTTEKRRADNLLRVILREVDTEEARRAQEKLNKIINQITYPDKDNRERYININYFGSLEPKRVRELLPSRWEGP